MYIDVSSPAKPIPIGVVGENLSRVVVWDISRWVADYGEGYAMLMAKRPVDEAPYPVPLVQSGNQALWRVRDVDLFAAGEGECQLSYAAGRQVVARTPVYRTLACRAIEGNPEDPENPGEGWVSEILQAGKDAQEGAAQAGQAAEEAGRSAASAEASAENAAQSAENAGNPKNRPRDGPTSRSRVLQMRGGFTCTGRTVYYIWCAATTRRKILHLWTTGKEC